MKLVSALKLNRETLTERNLHLWAVVLHGDPYQTRRTVKKSAKQSTRVAAVKAILLVGAPSPALKRRQRLLQSAGMDVVCSDNICTAEMISETQYFDGAVYDDSLPAHEQVSLAQVMRVRWPWMRLVRYGHVAGEERSDELFDASQPLEEGLAATLRNVLARNKN